MKSYLQDFNGGFGCYKQKLLCYLMTIALKLIKENYIIENLLGYLISSEI